MQGLNKPERSWKKAEVRGWWCNANAREDAQTTLLMSMYAGSSCSPVAYQPMTSSLGNTCLSASGNEARLVCVLCFLVPYGAMCICF